MVWFLTKALWHSKNILWLYTMAFVQVPCLTVFFSSMIVTPQSEKLSVWTVWLLVLIVSLFKTLFSEFKLRGGTPCFQKIFPPLVFDGSGGECELTQNGDCKGHSIWFTISMVIEVGDLLFSAHGKRFQWRINNKLDKIKQCSLFLLSLSSKTWFVEDVRKVQEFFFPPQYFNNPQGLHLNATRCKQRQ